MTKHHKRIIAATPEDVQRYAEASADRPAAADDTDGPGHTPRTPSAEIQPGGEVPAESDAGIDWKDKFLRAKADFQNLQRRSLEEQRSAVRFANADFARSLLDIIDDLERTLQAGAEQSSDAVLAAVRLIDDKLLKVLKDHHLEVIDALGKEFDPNRHEALMQQPSTEYPPGTVMQEVQKGYMLHDRVLRPARVVVAQAPPGGATGDPQA